MNNHFINGLLSIFDWSPEKINFNKYIIPDVNNSFRKDKTDVDFYKRRF